MAREIIINAKNLETRAVLLEDRKLEDLYLARDYSHQIVGNVYKGWVENVVPGIQAAFIDIGREQNVFLPVNGIIPHQSKGKIEDFLQPGEEVLVQIRKEGSGDKGPKGSCKLELPGRYLIFLDEPGHVGVSRKLPGEKRGILRQLAKQIVPKNKGVILRTEAGEAGEERIKEEFALLKRRREDIEKRATKEEAPALVYRRSNLIEQVLRDRFTEEVDKLVVDTEEGYEQILQFVEAIGISAREKVSYYQKKKPIFEHYQITNQLKQLLEKEVSLKSGGYLVLDTVEALTAVDVNTGTYTEDNIEDTIRQTNLEAAKQIPRQLRLRNISGIIVVDFIGMDKEEDRERVLEVLKDELAKDKIRNSLIGMTELGLVQITRQGEKNSIDQFLQSNCSCCEGRGKILSKKTLAWEAMETVRSKLAAKEAAFAVIKLSPHLGSYLLKRGKDNLWDLEEEFEVDLWLIVKPKLERGEVEIELKDAPPSFPWSKGDKIKVEVKDEFGEDGLAWPEGWMTVIEKGRGVVGEKIEIEIKRIDNLYLRAEIY